MAWIRSVSFAFLLSLSVTSHAWDGVKNGVPGVIEVTHGQNLGFRVHVTGAAKVCDSATTGFVYLNDNDSNYSTYVATILMAKAQGTPMWFYGVLDGNGHCRLGHLAMP